MKRRARVVVALMIAAAFAVVSLSGAQTTTTQTPAKVQAAKIAKQGKAVVHQTICPVMGNAIDKKLFVDFEGKRIYVCCAQCLETVKKDPAKYIKQLEAQGITLAKTPKKAEKKPVESLKGESKTPNKAK